jgi:hypothetical protein
VAYYPNFWLAVAAAAPVVALAGVVGITDAFKRMARLDIILEDSGKPWRNIGGRFSKTLALAIFVYALYVVSMFLQALVLGVALDSLAYNDNRVSPLIPLFALPIGIFALVLSVGLTVLLGAYVQELRTAFEGGSRDAQASPKPSSQAGEAASHSEDAALPAAAKPDPGAVTPTADAGAGTKPTGSPATPRSKPPGAPPGRRRSPRPPPGSHTATTKR